MTQTTPVIHYRNDYQAPEFAIQSVDLCVTLGEESTQVVSTLHIKALASGRTLTLMGDELDLVSVFLDERELGSEAFAATPDQLLILDVPEEFTLKTTCNIKPQNNKKLMGLYKSGGNFCTQCESEGFRRIAYYLDRPDVLSVFTTTLIADKAKYPVLLANGNLMAHGDMAGGQHFATWHDPHPKPSYLFAMVAGDLGVLEDQFTTMSGRNVTLKIFAAHDKIPQCHFAMSALKKSMRWDETAYGREYDLDIFMIVAVNDFNFGAMENKGLNIFNDRYILASPKTATDSDYAAIDAVVAHEYFHNWSGNRVTVRDWFQLSLKEGLTVFRDHSYSQDVGLRDVVRIQSVKALRQLQFPEDAGPLAHPIRPDSYIEMSNFYTATVYEKGAEVICMFKTLLGPEMYRKATDLYFDQHDGQAVTCEDFVVAMEEASGEDLTQFRLWYSQAGTPVVDVNIDYDADAQQLHLDFKQTLPNTPGQKNKQAMLIPITMALLDSEGQRMLDETVLKLTQIEQRFSFEGIASKPVVSLLRGFSAPIKLNIDLSDEELAVLIQHENDGFVRFEAMQTYLRRHLLRWIQGDALVVPDRMIGIFEALINDKQSSPALIAEMINLPSEQDLSDHQETVNIKATHRVRTALKQAIGQALNETILSRYADLSTDQTYAYHVDQVAARSLRGILLSYINDVAVSENAFTSADNMTDQYAALITMVHHDDPKAEAAIQAFHDQWQKETLVMDKWLAAQAMSEKADALDQVKALMNHPVFNIENPNKVRALISTFAKFNPVHFHTEAGYALLREVVMKVDSINPMTAARLMAPFTQWQRYDADKQTMMKAALEAILKRPGVSKDVYELASKSLA
ncbi:MAG: aminopeptidase N [Gammaproteobacteria bacterium CG11_big_fil_rev_8_21_14_0_20_46_22]|nr:MAG: aminopeptidase N [Gammaproteobacteria bacterium CG12_big_fil_rev_8_21_14_0_65_46_12]PIR10898.1 MAG: aminopeptidase N [Gammaproteobacteria bacterium CG11_big_fil_rev_8_21_14_0_20_46_22]